MPNICPICGEEIDLEDFHHDNVMIDSDGWPTGKPDPRWSDDACFHDECCPICNPSKAVN